MRRAAAGGGGRRRAATGAAIIWAGSLALALGGSVPHLPKATPYAEARQSLKALGYRPNALPDADAVSRERCGDKPDSLAGPRAATDANGEDGDLRCYPEMVACAGSGLGQCIYSWRRGETLIDVLTTNELPLVRAVKCRVNC